MKSIFVVVVVAAFALAEPPLSHSYLPPSPTNRNAGYPKGPDGSLPIIPQVVAARALVNGHLNGARSSLHEHGQVRRGQAQGYDGNSGDLFRNTVDVSSEPANYNFGYMVNDFNEGTDFGHHEERLEERAQGEYHVVLPDGRKQTVSYEADERGFKPQISYEDTEDLTRSNGYNGNANTRNIGNGYKSGQDARSGY
ncbi:unnamed protein product, partial [Brenthis ino]